MDGVAASFGRIQECEHRRQAAAFQELKDKTSTRLLLQKIIKAYPSSSEAAIAKERLDALK